MMSLYERGRSHGEEVWKKNEEQEKYYREEECKVGDDEGRKRRVKECTAEYDTIANRDTPT